MRCKIIELYRDGRRIAKEDAIAADPIVGELVISDWFYGNSAGRPLREASLFEITSGGYNRKVIPPLFEPTILRMKKGDGGFVLRGWQIKAEHQPAGGAVTEFAQEWWVRPWVGNKDNPD